MIVRTVARHPFGIALVFAAALQVAASGCASAPRYEAGVDRGGGGDTEHGPEGGGSDGGESDGGALTTGEGDTAPLEGEGGEATGGGEPPDPLAGGPYARRPETRAPDAGGVPARVILPPVAELRARARPSEPLTVPCRLGAAFVEGERLVAAPERLAALRRALAGDDLVAAVTPLALPARERPWTLDALAAEAAGQGLDALVLIVTRSADGVAIVLDERDVVSVVELRAADGSAAAPSATPGRSPIGGHLANRAAAGVDRR